MISHTRLVEELFAFQKWRRDFINFRPFCWWDKASAELILPCVLGRCSPARPWVHSRSQVQFDTLANNWIKHAWEHLRISRISTWRVSNSFLIRRGQMGSAGFQDVMSVHALTSSAQPPVLLALIVLPAVIPWGQVALNYRNEIWQSDQKGAGPQGAACVWRQQ